MIASYIIGSVNLLFMCIGIWVYQADTIFKGDKFFLVLIVANALCAIASICGWFLR